MSVPGPRKRSPFEAPVILTSAPRSSLFFGNSRPNSPRHATLNSSPPARPCHPPETTDRNNTSFSPKSISRSPDPRSGIPPLSAFSFPTHSFPSHLSPPLPPPLLDALPPRLADRRHDRLPLWSCLPLSFDQPAGLRTTARRMPRRGTFHMFSTRFPTPPLATRFIFLRPTHVALANSLALVTP